MLRVSNEKWPRAIDALRSSGIIQRARFLLIALSILTGCSIGPPTLRETHLPYNEALKTVLEEQLLLNIVRLRYNDTPVRLDVANIAAQTEVDTSEGIQPFFTATSNSGIFRSFNSILPIFSVKTADRPTLSYRPLDDPDTVRRFLQSGTLDNIVFLAETSWPVSSIFPLYIDYLNNVPNAVSANGPPRGVTSDSSQFHRVVELLQALQDAGDIHFVTKAGFLPMGSPLPPAAFRAEAQAEAAKNGLVYLRKPDGSWVLSRPSPRLFLKINPEAVDKPQVRELCKLLHLKPGLTLYELITSSSDAFSLEASPGAQATTINVLPRSTIQALFYLSRGVQVPEDHLREGVVTAEGTPPTLGLFKVAATGQSFAPSNAAVAVKYRGYWYYIDDRDIESKRTFSLMLLMAQISAAKTAKEGPVLTLPLGGGGSSP